MKNNTHAIILDDHQLFADSFSLLLEKYELFGIVQTFYTSDRFMAALQALGNQGVYIFLDYYLKDEIGLSLLSEIKRLNKLSKIIFVTSAVSPLVLNNLSQYLPNGILSKSCSLDTVITCLKEIKEGNHYIEQCIQEYLKPNIKTTLFTPREIQLLKYFADGFSISDTADKVFLSSHTIIAHRRKMMLKANCNSITQLLKYAKDHEMI